MFFSSTESVQIIDFESPFGQAALARE